MVIQAGDPGVGYTWWGTTDSNGDPISIHVLTWNTYCSANCTYKYTVRQNVGGQIYSNGPYTFPILGCAIITQ